MSSHVSVRIIVNDVFVIFTGGLIVELLVVVFFKGELRIVELLLVVFFTGELRIVEL